jgi:2-phospho-L-lactate guanylyltransferase
LRFGDDSFLPHLAAAKARGIAPTVVRLPGIAFDIDNPEDLARFARLGRHTRAGALLVGNAMVPSDIAAPPPARGQEVGGE